MVYRRVIRNGCRNSSTLHGLLQRVNRRGDELYRDAGQRRNCLIYAEKRIGKQRKNKKERFTTAGK